ncbi:MAG TPA: hypothetical protein VGM05_29685 [Planctomycetaceae bacterium]
MTINGHLLLLVVATGLFVRLWGTNDRQRHPAVWRTPNRAASTLPPPQPVAADRDIPAQFVSTTSGGDSTPEEVWTASTCPIPLPAGMDAGTFRVVDDMGRVARLVLTAPVASIVDSFSGSADIQTMSVNSRRWYFIRLQTPVARTTLECEVEGGTSAPAANVDAAPLRIACVNRKFDFTGFDATASSTASSTAAQSVEEFRPESPALPATE